MPRKSALPTGPPCCSGRSGRRTWRRSARPAQGRGWSSFSFFNCSLVLIYEQGRQLTQREGAGFLRSARSRRAGVLEVRQAESDAAMREKPSQNAVDIAGIAQGEEDFELTGTTKIFVGIARPPRGHTGCGRNERIRLIARQIVQPGPPMGTADAVMHRAHHAHPAGQSRARGAVASAFSIFYMKGRIFP